MTPARWATLASIALFAVSLGLPVFHTDHNNHWLGLSITVVGWVAALEFIFAWYANPLVALAWFLLLMGVARKATLLLTAGAVALAATAFFVTDFSNISSRERVLEVGPGLYVWFASMVLALVAAILPPGKPVGVGASVD